MRFRNISFKYRNTLVTNSRDRLNGDFQGDSKKLVEFHKSLRFRWKDISTLLGAKDLGESMAVEYPICFLEAYKPKVELK